MNLSQLFQRSVQMYPDCTAIACGDQIRRTYRELDQRVGALAHWFRQDLGLQPGDRLLLVMKNCPEYIESLLAAWRAELCVVPVNSKLHPNEIAAMAQDAGTRKCLSQGSLAAALREHPTIKAQLDVIDAGEDAYLNALGSPQLSVGRTHDENAVAWLFFTSGTTGRSKGVMITHANLVNVALNFFSDVQSVSQGDALIHVAPVSHGSGIYSIPYWIKGGTQVLPESGGFDEAELFRLLDTHQRASLFAAPTMVQRMVRYANENNVRPSGLRALLVGGAPFYMEDIKTAVQSFGPRIAQVYGQGESPMTISRISADQIGAAVNAGDSQLLGSVGFPMTSVQVSIVDNDGCPVAAGELGEVMVRGPVVMAGYWNNPQATASTVIDGALRTGDVGLIDERGLLHLRDRSKDVIISGGTNIYPREVEEVLLTHPGVAEVSVVGAPDPEWGESVVAFIVRQPGTVVEDADLNAHCLNAIARFKRPKRYIYVFDLPKNGIGKVLKRELQKQIGKST
ncbi:AMP-binding protein [Noviherbaspirillum sp. L7-7A]|uniref:AMP-binding protein n=1 Tax=Noviherbaspirillum sp. L7-7A TaxID=2850560 RepID=UPI001C2BC8EC|nr:AMP-binding protein [Noviherbaspirillum sp. L7-7A]MBV0881520.1 AMP-binding protein [Noviherbaspirillum sp. L7-7A]